MRPFQPLLFASLLIFVGPADQSRAATTLGPGFSPSTLEIRGPDGEELTLSSTFVVADGLPSIVWDVSGLSYPGGADFGISAQSWVASDSSAALGYVATLARSNPQITATWLLSVSMGSSETRSESLRMAIEAWMANSENRESPPWDIIEGDRYRGRRGEDPQGLYGIGGEDTIPPGWTSGANMIYNDGVVASVPEPSSALLIGLGSLSLLTRRRRAS